MDDIVEPPPKRRRSSVFRRRSLMLTDIRTTQSVQPTTDETKGISKLPSSDDVKQDCVTTVSTQKTEDDVSALVYLDQLKEEKKKWKDLLLQHKSSCQSTRSTTGESSETILSFNAISGILNQEQKENYAAVGNYHEVAMKTDSLLELLSVVVHKHNNTVKLKKDIIAATQKHTNSVMRDVCEIFEELCPLPEVKGKLRTGS